MLNRRTGLFIMAVTLTACTKQGLAPANQSNASSADNAIWFPWPNSKGQGNGNGTDSEETTFGLIQEQEVSQSTQEGIADSKKKMKKADVNVTRIQIALAATTINKTIDDFLSNGYEVQILANWNDDLNGARQFPVYWELDSLKARAEAFFAYYAPYRKQIPFIAIENEWDWQVVHGSVLQDYLTELNILTDIGHKYGFKIADGGITSTALQRWTYSQLPPDEQDYWLSNYFVGLTKGAIEYNYLMGIVNAYIAGAKNIDFDYSNVHWGNNSKCGNGFSTATEIFADACDKKTVVCNEFYIRTNSYPLFDSTINEIKGNSKYALGYSGNDNDALAIKFTDDMLYDISQQ